MTTNTRDTILQIAERLFILQGYTATSIRQIAAESGIGKATIYHHFTSKEAIAIALIDRSSKKAWNILCDLPTAQDPRQRLNHIMQTRLAFLNNSSELLSILRRELPGGHERLQQSYQAFLVQFRQTVRDALQDGIDQGIFRSIRIEDATMAMLAMIQGTFAMALLSGEPALVAEETTAILMNIFLQGINQRENIDKS